MNYEEIKKALVYSDLIKIGCNLTKDELKAIDDGLVHLVTIRDKNKVFNATSYYLVKGKSNNEKRK